MTCPACGGSAVHRSRVRALTERARTHLTSRRPHRCLVCGWRGWLAPGDVVAHAKPAFVTCEPLDLHVVDATLDQAAGRSAKSPGTTGRAPDGPQADVTPHRV